MYEVLEHAGMFNQTTVFQNESYKKCTDYITENYDQDEKEELRVDIIKDGSTEY